jgi:hypothetical protein
LGIGGPPNKKAARGRPTRFVMRSCKRPTLAGTQVGERDLRIKKPISGRPEIGAQFQLWIFSYTAIFECARVKFGVI